MVPVRSHDGQNERIRHWPRSVHDPGGGYGEQSPTAFQVLCACPAATCGLEAQERSFYRFLLAQQRGRIEQERLPEEAVAQELRRWVSHC
jgi:hypothetical protein